MGAGITAGSSAPPSANLIVEFLKRGFGEKDVTVSGQFVLTQKEIGDEQKIKVIIDGINRVKSRRTSPSG